METQENQNPEVVASQSRHTRPHSGKHPIPTVQEYRDHRKELKGQMRETEEAQHGPEDDSKVKRAYDSAKAVIKNEDKPQTHFDPYQSGNRNYADRPKQEHREQSD